jgi:serine/threonine protein kinase
VSELAAAFPQLEIVELIGHGGMGAVYKARQKSLGRWVALKILAPQHASKADFAERFSREAKVLAEVNHPHIVTVHDFGQAGEFYFLLMEFVDGVSLRQAMRAGRFTPEQALSMVPPICEALQFAHEHGIVHRDIKPENLLLDKEGRVKIADFGIARMMRSADDLSSLPSPPGRGAGGEGFRHANIDLTQEAVLGTPRYMAPEQRDRPASVDHRADIYSLGVVLYEMLTGELPGPNWQPPSRQSAADVRLDQIVQRALEQNPDLRYQSATELRTQIETSITQLPPDMASQLMEKSSDEDESELGEINTLMRDMTYAYSQWDKLTVIIYFVVAVSLSHLAFGFPHFSPTSHEINVLLYAFGATIVGGTMWIIARFFLRRRATAAAPQRSDEAFKTSTATPATLASESEPDLETTWGWHGLILALLGLLWLLDYLDVLEGKAKLFGLLGFLGIATYIEHWVIPSKKSGQSPLAGKHRDTILDRTFHRNQPHWLHAYFQTDLGRRLFLFGCFGFLSGLTPFYPHFRIFFGLFGCFGLATLVEVVHRKNAKTPLTPQPVKPRPAVPQRTQLDILAELFGFTTVWGRRCLMISWLGGFGFLGFAKGLEPMLNLFGLFGFLLVALLIEGWVIPVEKSPLKQVFRKHWKLITGFAVAFAVYLGMALFVIPEFKTHADVVMRNPAMEGSFFVFDHEVECPPGWNVWVSLVSNQGSEVERYQAQLTGTGHVRLPVRLMTQAIGNSRPTLPPKFEAYRLAPGRGAGWTFFGDGLVSALSRSRINGIVTLMMHPEGESPASQDRVPYTTIKPPSRPQSAPFVASYEQGKIEIVRLTPHPSDGQIQWMPNGQPCTEKFLPDRDGRSSSSGRVIKEITVRVLSNSRDPSWPVLRFPEKFGFSGMGGSFHRATDQQPATIMVQTIACPPEAREMTVEVGVADGAWKTEISFEPVSYPNQRQYHRSTHGRYGEDWQGTVQIADAVGDKLPVSFSYTDRDDADTRLVYELADGKLVTMPDTSGLGDSRTGLITIPVSEFEKIKQFHVQSRRYQWTEFRNVSLELGHQTEVEISEAY